MSKSTQGELEAAVCKGVARIQQELMGRGPEDIRCYLIADFLVVRLQGVLTVSEHQLVASLPAEKGRGLLKDARTHLIESARAIMETVIESAAGVHVVSMHHDVSTITGEEVILFALDDVPDVRGSRK